MIQQLSDTNHNNSPYKERITIQSEIVKRALLFLSDRCDGAHDQDGQGFNSVDSEFGKQLAFIAHKLSPKQEYAAWKLCRKYWRQLRKANPEIILPKKWLNTYKLDGWLVYNLSKGTGPYTLEWVGEDELSCTCEAYVSGGVEECSHIKFAKPLLINAQVNQDISDTMALVKELTTVDDLLSSIQPGEPSGQYFPVNKSFEKINNKGKEILPGIYATPDQENALRELQSFIQGESSIHLLTGYAGTGKTVLIQALIKRLRDAGDDCSIVFTAPTNKATQVLRKMVAKWGLGIECVTCAKLLGLRPSIDQETGKEIFLKSYNEESAAQSYDLIVVDEISMANLELWGYLQEEANFFTKLLCMGDCAQLPPVNEAISMAFVEITSQSNLTKVMRYKGSIAAVADDIRRNLKRRGEPILTSDYIADGSEGLFVMPLGSWEKNLIKAFQADKYLEDPDYCRALAYTNKRVSAINTMVRASIRGPQAERFEKGERLMASQHYAMKDSHGGSTTLFHTSSEMEVLEVMVGNQGKRQVYFLTVHLFEDGQTLMVPVLHEDSMKEFSAEQKDLAKRAKSGENHLWEKWHDNRKAFAQLDYAYATTVHKSQGSTFGNVFVDVPNIMSNKRRNTIELPGQPKQVVFERNQLLYVAFTRPSKRLFVYE